MTKTKKQLRAEAVERLKNCVAARFDAESIVIALTSGRHGQSDWSLECDKLIYLLTDDANDDSTPEKVVSGSEPCVTPESCRQYADQRKQGDDADCESCDSREQLEADAFAYLQTAYITYPQIIELLDRQAAITAHQWESYHNGMMLEWMAKTEELQEQVDEMTAERVKLRSQICKLEDDLVGTSDERDNWKANCEDWKNHARAAENACYETMLEREHYRSKFGKCLDYADAIHALMDDEGMA